MKRLGTIVVLVLLLPGVSAGAEWRQFRGTQNDSVSSEKNLPITFADDEKKQENVAWKVPLPGRGPSSPIVVDGRVVVTCSGGARHDRLHVLCFDAATGKKLWHRQLWATGHTTHHPFGAVATPTPASDGKFIFAFYSSNDLACFDLDGNLQWFRGLAHDYPTMRNDVGMSSSPLVVGDVVVVQMENQGESFVAGIDKKTGRTRWRIDRDHDAVWSSPTVFRPGGGKDYFVLQGRGRVSVYDAANGESLCEFELPCHTIASATTHQDTIYVPAAGLHRLSLKPIPKGKKASVDSARELDESWYASKLRSGNASPVVYDGRCYTLKPPGILCCADAEDGKMLWQLRLKGPFWATPVAADGRLYCVNHRGLVQVVEIGKEGKLLGTSQIEPGILASPAAADGALYFRSDQNLWKVARDAKQE